MGFFLFFVCYTFPLLADIFNRFSDQYQTNLMAYVKVYCKKSKTKPNGLAPIYFVIRINNKEKRKRETGKIQGIKLNNLGEGIERHGNNR